MVNPTGYTALDLVGYTDKGTYSNSANYVANDLVHYGGNIWRCKVDDTTGVAPVEGADWTLFIGEPTNMAERMIAPLEVSPSANAYAVGAQLIYNDTLYEVISAISVGDTLTVDSNIQLAPKISRQIQKAEVLIVNVASFSALPQTVSNTEIESDMVVVNSLLSNPSAQTGDWTVTTTNGSLTVTGTISGTTALTLYLMKSR